MKDLRCIIIEWLKVNNNKSFYGLWYIELVLFKKEKILN